jgi:DNA-binding transcriptional MerR regulator/methylmalonyl-CoA mutase cobalamin-binding subunit
MSTNQAMMKQGDLFPIRTVAAVTGVNPVTLRAWERRYGLIKPARTPKGHRLYSQQDVDRIKQTVSLLNRGISISQVNYNLDTAAPDESENNSRTCDTWTAYRAQAIMAIIRFDENKLDMLYNEALSLYPIDIVTEHMLLPLLVSLGERWASSDGSIAEEHFFGTFMRNKLGARFHHRSKISSGKKLLVSCMPGEQHEIGSMLFSLAAHDHGFRIVYLGADMPLRELVFSAKRAACDAIVISASIDPSEHLLKQELPRLVKTSPYPVFIGGQTSIRHADLIKRAGAHAIGTEIRGSIRRMDEIFHG